MNWLPLGKSISIDSQRKWTEPTDRSWFRFDFAPATDGQLEVNQGDGDLTIGTPIYSPTDRSPIALYLPTPSLIAAQNKRLALYSRQRLKIRIYVLAVEPIGIDPISPSTNLVSTNSMASIIDSTIDSTILLEANPNRKGATIYNHSNSTLFIDFDSTASMEDCALVIPPRGYYEVPFNIQTKITGVWSSSSGVAFVRELT